MKCIPLKPSNLFAVALIVLTAAALNCSGGEGTDALKDSDGQSIEVARAESKILRRELRLPGELIAYRDVAIVPKVTGYVQEVFVDRGSRVEHGARLAVLTAPELAAKRSEAEAKLKSAQAELAEAGARCAVSEATYKRLKKAAETPGAVSGNDLDAAMQEMEADRARVEYGASGEAAARESLRAFQDMEAYLEITAPFSGIITERNVHEGALVGGGMDQPVFRLKEIERLRLIIYVPESETAGIIRGSTLRFTVAAYPGQPFSGVVERIAYAVDSRTRTMPVELDVSNADGRLSPGMYAEVVWQSTRPNPTLFVPQSAVVATTGKIFVIRIRDGKAEYVPVEKGSAMDNRIEVFGALENGDLIVARGNDELREGAEVNPVEIQAE